MNLSRKIGGVPLWAWGGALVGGLLFGIYLRRKGSQASTGQPFATSALPSLGNLTQGATGTSDGAGLGSGLDPNMLALLEDSQSALVASQQVFAGLADSSTRGALDLAGRTVDNAFGFASAQSQASYGFAASLVDKLPTFNMPSSSGSGSGSGYSQPAPYAPAPAAPSVTSTFTSNPFGDPNLKASSQVAQDALAARRAPPGGF